jgi:hypothetical protein
VESRRPELKQFVNHWATEHLLKECFGNLHFYHNKQSSKPSKSKGSRLIQANARAGGNKRSDKAKGKAHDSDNDSDGVEYRIKVDAHRAALRRSIERKALKRKADSQGNNEGLKDVKRKATKKQDDVKHEDHEDAEPTYDMQDTNCSGRKDEDDTQSTDETELEDLPEKVRKAIERDEIGIPCTSLCFVCGSSLTSACILTYVP